MKQGIFGKMKETPNASEALKFSIMQDIEIYKKWKSITDKMYAGKISEGYATEKLIELLNEYNTKPRPGNHKLLAKSYFVYDKDQYEDPKKQKPLGLGLVYEKSDGSNTQDIFIVSPAGELDRFYNEKEMIKKYPAMKGTHKDNLPL